MPKASLRDSYAFLFPPKNTLFSVALWVLRAFTHFVALSGPERTVPSESRESRRAVFLFSYLLSFALSGLAFLEIHPPFAYPKK